MKAKEIKVICNDGIGRGIKLIDIETGEELPLPVTRIVWEVGTSEFSKLTLEIEAIPAELTSKEVEVLCKNCPKAQGEHELNRIEIP